MENREAIASLKTLCNTCTMYPRCVNDKPECFQAIEMAISALEKQEQEKWIPVTERLPEEKDAGILKKLGYFTVRGKTYYAHYSKSQMYDKGELLTNGYRVRNGKLYYFGPDGAMITRKTSRNRTTRYIDFNKDGSVHYVSPAGYGEVLERYNANRQRFQKYVDGEWKDTGMQCWPYGWIDWQL